MIFLITLTNYGSYFDAAVFHQLIPFKRFVETQGTKCEYNKSLGKHLQFCRAKNEKVKNQLVIRFEV
jgi:hypothetical protein